MMSVPPLALGVHLSRNLLCCNFNRRTIGQDHHGDMHAYFVSYAINAFRANGKREQFHNITTPSLICNGAQSFPRWIQT